MVAVSPTSADIHSAHVPARRSVRLIRAVVRWILRIAGRLPGEYTIGKLDSLRDFQAETTSSRLISILFITPVPCFLSNVLVEIIALANPSSGFKGSLCFQIRHFLGGIIVSTMPLLVKFTCVPQLSIRSWGFIAGYTTVMAVVTVGSTALISTLSGVFPVPFAQFAPAAPLGIVAAIINSFFLQTPETKARLDKIDQWATMDVIPILVYPIFTTVFMALKSTHQIWLSILLPVIKRFTRQMVWHILKDDLDLVGATACSVSHLYHVLFTAMCLQNAKSLETLVALVLVNILQMLLNCWDITKDAEALNQSRTRFTANSIVLQTDAVSAALQLADEKEILRSLHQKSPSRVISKYPGYQRSEFMTKCHKVLQELPPVTTQQASVLPRQGNNQRSLKSAKSLSKQTQVQLGLAQIAILPDAMDAARAQTFPSKLPTQGDQIHRSEAFIRNITTALHQTEIILLRSYITIFVLTFYGIYLTLVFWMPNRKYYATMKTITTLADIDAMLFHLILLASLEMVFMAVYLVLISWRLGVSGIHQLAFVLWSQRMLIQNKFLTLTLMILGFPLEHYGNGIIFRLQTG
ncbi:hypothetical protein V7S43_015646 [Phytophthora oleae]|uniref:Uncharacterized protein n=1 Tax=Phytophthora oleae TaxID=2107226 RepID=A0ABD3EZU3_9STRA